MKNIFLTLISVLSLTSCIAQIIPVEQQKHYYDINNDDDDDNDIDIADGTYFKDVNGVLNEFVGTWTGTFNEKVFELRIEKITTSATFIMDELQMRYKITDSNGIIIEDNINSSSFDKKFWSGWFYPNLEVYYFDYLGEESLCGQSGGINIRVNNNDPNKLHFNYRQLNSEFFNEQRCPNGVVDQVLPIGTTILTKQ